MSHDIKYPMILQWDFDTFTKELREFISLFIRQPQFIDLRQNKVMNHGCNIFEIINEYNYIATKKKGITLADFQYFRRYTEHLKSSVIPYWLYCLDCKCDFNANNIDNWNNTMNLPFNKSILKTYTDKALNPPKFNGFNHPYVYINSKFKDTNPELFK